MSKGSATGTENGMRVVHDTGSIELKQQKAKINAKMFQFMKTKKGGKKR